MTISRLVACFDGTWNTPEDNTNVLRLYQAVADRSQNVSNQVKFYDPGVGTQIGSRFGGGMFGNGLEDNVLQGYVWLCKNYASTGQDGEYSVGPDIFLFGFSRGAFTARSLGGMVNRCGLVKLENFSKDELRSEAAMRNNEYVKKAWMLYRRTDINEGRDHKDCREFRARYSHTTRIKFIGVWDTVGALGIPNFSNAALPVYQKRFEFHDLKLGAVIQNAYHAVAIDENRESFNVALWDKISHSKQVIEQRWFPGAHANVGGGYEDDRLPDLSLNWMAQKATACGLELLMKQWGDVRVQPEAKSVVPPYLELDGDEYEDRVRDSYAEFMGGAYKVGKWAIGRGRYYRAMIARGINESIDQSAHMKWAADPSYRPRNLSVSGRYLEATDLMAMGADA